VTASDLKPGDVVDRWTVVRTRNARELVDGYFCDSVVLVTLECLTEVSTKSDLGWAEDMPGLRMETKRSWFPADEEVMP
jgi:hypothetical protein